MKITLTQNQITYGQRSYLSFVYNTYSEMISTYFCDCAKVTKLFVLWLLKFPRNTLEAPNPRGVSQKNVLNCLSLSLGSFLWLLGNVFGSRNEVLATFFAKRLTLSLPLVPMCSGIQQSATLFPLPSLFSLSIHSQTYIELIMFERSAFMTV